MKQLLTLILGLLLLSCNTTTKTEKNETKADLTTKEKNQKAVDFNDFKILKGQLGKMKIGMTIPEAESQFTGLTKKTDEAMNFGFGGGSPAYLYYLDNEPVFGLIPELESDTLLFIIAVHKKLRTESGLNPNSTVEILLNEYPNLRVQRDLMNDWEFFKDQRNRWDFVFMTDNKTQIGVYPNLEVLSKPKRLKTKADWITIR